MTRRQRFLLCAALLSLGLLAIQWVRIDYRYVAVFCLAIATYLISAFALFDDLKGVEWMTVLLLPTMYTVGVSLFYFLLPTHWLYRLAILFFYGLGLYALYLTENIYSVAASRTIQLLRAAHVVGFLLSLVTLVLLYNTIYSLRWPFWFNGLLVAGASFPVLLQSLWAVKLESKLSKHIWVMTIGLSLMLGQTAMILSLLPVTVWVASLFLATMVYVTIGLMQHTLEDRLFTRTIQEYLIVGVFVLLATLMVTQWR